MMTMSNLYKQELVKLSNSIQTIKKHETSFEGMIKFILVQKNGTEYQLNLLEAALQKLRERDFNTSSHLFSKQEALIGLIKSCPNLQTIGLILKEHHLFLTNDTYDFGTRILEAVYEQFKSIASRIKSYDCFMVVPFDDFGRTKKNDPGKPWNKINLEGKQAYQARIFIMIEFVVCPLVEYYSSVKPAILQQLRIVIKWLLFISDYGDPDKLNLIKKLARNILPKICYPMSNANSSLLYCFNVMMRVLALPFYQQQIIKPINNIGLFLIDFPEIVIEKLCVEWFKTIKPGDLPKHGFINIISNLLDCMTQFQSLKIIYYLSKELNKSNNTQDLAFIYQLVVKKKMLEKLYIAPNSFKLAIDILLYYIVGFVNSDRIGQQLQQLVLNYRDILEQTHMQQIMKSSHQLVAVSLNVLCFKNTSVIPLVFLLEVCQYRFKSLTHKTQQILKQLKQKYQVEIDFYDMEKYIKGNMFEHNFTGRSSINQNFLIPSNRYKGLENVGNTCYMNSFLQVLFTTTRFNTLISQIGNPNNQQQSKRPCFVLHQLFQDLRVSPKQNNLDPVVPYKFKKLLMEPFASSKDQQDSAEFGRLYLEHILNDFSKESFFSEQLERLFFNRTVSQISCNRCQSRSNREEKILDYILPLSSNKKDPEFISTLFKNYFMVQHLDQYNTVFCNKCQSQQQISTRIYPKQFSTIITLTLNRFLYDRTEQKRIKLLNPVALQLQIDIHNITPVASNCKYTLQAFIVHIGLSAQAGHYVAYARNIDENPNLWYVFDDGYVSEREIYDVKDFNLGEYETPYILFYNSQQSMMSSMHLRDSQASISSRISNR